MCMARDARNEIDPCPRNRVRLCEPAQRSATVTAWATCTSHNTAPGNGWLLECNPAKSLQCNALSVCWMPCPLHRRSLATFQVLSSKKTNKEATTPGV
jgi:hypothetical protein